VGGAAAQRALGRKSVHDEGLIRHLDNPHFRIGT